MEKEMEKEKKMMTMVNMFLKENISKVKNGMEKGKNITIIIVN